MTNWTAKTSQNVTTVRFESMAAGDVTWVLLRSDAHHDSPYCNRKLERQHLELAKERNALIFDAGDTFDAMQGKFDPRRTMEDVREEDRCADYYGSIVTHAAENYLPFAKNWVMFGKGNHETAVLDKANTDLISNLVYRLNSESGSNIVAGGYGGWVRLMLKFNSTKAKTYRMKYHHGSGGSAPVTRGAIQTNRQAVFEPDADIVWNGHNHQGYTIPIARERLSRTGKVSTDIVWFIRTPGYKDEWTNVDNSYGVRMNSGPTPQGCAWLKFYIQSDQLKMSITSDIE